MPKIRVLLTDDHALFRQGVRTLIAAEPDMEVAGEAGNASEAVELARRAVMAASADDTMAQCWAGFVLGYSGEDIHAAIALVDRALALHPSYALGWLLSGLLRIYSGDLHLALEHVERSIRLNPRARIGLPNVTGTPPRRRIDSGFKKRGRFSASSNRGVSRNNPPP